MKTFMMKVIGIIVEVVVCVSLTLAFLAISSHTYIRVWKVQETRMRDINVSHSEDVNLFTAIINGEVGDLFDKNVTVKSVAFK